jgi:hypothetical protein
MTSSYTREEKERNMNYRENIDSSEDKNCCESLFPHRLSHPSVSERDWFWDTPPLYLTLPRGNQNPQMVKSFV